ncbi:sugar phosphate isomerase/epimerase and 4-hydroxyphenylpyruvate domain-containing protein [Nonomuraea soli]|uniref:3-dehydroshikimate dehydratase n=1 Tax=Nonomuraea soli TaxID=1032476 RepID=A0A7W0CSV7_9ACTN|nr:sugar phosphate isomerase/epimerase and 4-hydroxyphenylpyruvate domain-containing protein [Nonomuraea soli]MBA2896607.1 4-hydroxyphenylpyruvate dioxygenase [Nonomuraea soli]
MRKSIATVSVSGTLVDKLEAIAAAGFDGVEIFEHDLITCPLPPEEVRRRAADLGLTIDLYQPFRDFEAMPELDLRRADRKFRLMERLGADLLLVCSNVSPLAAGDDDLAAEHLRLLAGRAAEHGIRIAYEALAWGRHVNDYLHSWRIVRAADHPNLGVCLDSFHILSRGSDPIGIEAIPGDKIFFLQLADAPLLAMDVLQWSRHHRCFPGQGGFDLPGFLSHVRAAGYRGPLSLEVFNDHFRQTDARRTALDAMRSLIALEGTAHEAAAPSGFAFAELTGGLRDLASALGFTRTGVHGTKPVELWEQGEARLLLHATGHEAALTAIGLESPEPTDAVKRAESLLAPVLPRVRARDEAKLDAIAAPDGTQIFFCRTAQPGGWLQDFDPARAGSQDVTHIDHIALAQPVHHFDEAELFYRQVLGLSPQESLEFADPYGLLRSKAMTGGGTRMVLNVAHAAGQPPSQHVALACADLLRLARRLRAEHPGLLLPIPANYYDDLEARHEVDPELRELGVLYDRDEHGEFLHLYTVTVGRVFFELVQRFGGYQGYGAANAPVRLAVQHSRMSP